MLEKIMNLHLLLYAMTVLGWLGVLGMLATHLTYRRLIRKNTGMQTNLKEKWLNLWKTRDRLLSRMNRLVWYPSLFCTVLLGLAFFLSSRVTEWDGLPLGYLYVGAIVPTALLLLRQALDFSFKEELVMNSLADYILQVRSARKENLPTARKYETAESRQKADPILKEEAVERIAASIRQTAATGSHFSKMLSPEEEEIMREIIREFME